MDNVQKTVNRLALLLRLQVIEFLFIEDRIKYGVPPLSDEEMTVNKRLVNRLPCSTKYLPKLFDDVHRMQMDVGMFPHAANVGEMEFCLRERCIGLFNHGKVDWMPALENRELRRLPACKELDSLYKKLKAKGRGIIPPVEEETVQQEALAIINGTADAIGGGREEV
jgi:hypothetical protein